MNINNIAKAVHAANIKWWQDVETGQPIKRNKGELLALVHSELSEAYDGEQGALMDDKLPHRPMVEVELVDAAIRIFDYAAGMGHDIGTQALKFGLSEFIDLNHLYACCNKTPVLGFAGAHSKVSCVLELERKGHASPEVAEALVELLLYIFGLANLRECDMQGAFDEKMAFNALREDHKHEARRIAGGKQF